MFVCLYHGGILQHLHSQHLGTQSSKAKISKKQPNTILRINLKKKKNSISTVVVASYGQKSLILYIIGYQLHPFLAFRKQRILGKLSIKKKYFSYIFQVQKTGEQPWIQLARRLSVELSQWSRWRGMPWPPSLLNYRMRSPS